MRPFKLSTAVTLRIGPCLDSAGAEYTGLVIGDLTLTKAGTSAAMAAAATLTHVANGHYSLVTIAGNTDTLGSLRIDCAKATYQIPPVEGEVLPATVFDALVTNAAGGANGLLLSDANNRVDLAKWIGTAPLALSSQQVQAVVPITQKVDVETIKTNPVANGGTFTFPTNSTGASTTNITAGVITTVGTLTTYTGNTPQTGDSFARIGALGAGLTAADDAVLSAIAALNNLSAAAAAAAVWDELSAGHATAGSYGVYLDGKVSNVKADVWTQDISANSTNGQAGEYLNSIVADARTAITGGAYALSTDANGRIRIVDGTATGELDTSSGKIFLAASQSFDNAGQTTSLPATLSNGVTHGGTTALLRLGASGATAPFLITNSNGPGLDIQTAGGQGMKIAVSSGNFSAFYGQGSGSAHGFNTIGGATGNGWTTSGGATSGNGLHCDGTGTAAALGLDTNNADGITGTIGGSNFLIDGTLSTAAVDSILDRADGIETGATLRQALRSIAAKSMGVVSGAGTGTEVVKGIGVATTRGTAAVDSSGNIAWTLNL